MIKKDFLYQRGIPYDVQIIGLDKEPLMGNGLKPYYDPRGLVDINCKMPIVPEYKKPRRNKTNPLFWRYYRFIVFRIDGRQFAVTYTEELYNMLLKQEMYTFVLLPRSKRVIDIIPPQKTTNAEDIIYFKDKYLENEIKEILGVKGREIFKRDLKGLQSLDLSNKNILLLDGLEYATDLEKLSLQFNDIRDISPLSSLKELKELNLAHNQIAIIEQIGELTNLERLNLGQNNIVNIVPLANLEKLEHLVLYHNRIKRISPIIDLKQLKYLDIRKNEISDYIVLDKMNISMVLDDRSKIL